MIPNRQNYIEVEIGGAKRKIKMGMETMQKIGDLLLHDTEALYNPITRVVRACLFGLDRKENNLPDGFNESMLLDWIDELPQAVWDEIEEFVSTALGFTIEILNQKMDSLYKTTEQKQESVK
jgi:hypothetical protein